MRLDIVPRSTASSAPIGTEDNLLDSGSDPPSCAVSASSPHAASKLPLDAHVRDSTPTFQKLVADNAHTWQAPDPHFVSQLEEAAKDPNLQSCSEQTENAMRMLLMHGIIVNTDPSRRTLGNFIVQHLLQPTTPYDLQLTLDGEEPMTVPTHTRLLFVHLAVSLNCTVYLFSNRAMPRVYRPSGGSFDRSRVCGIFHIVDSYLATSQYLVLSFVNRTDKRRIQRQDGQNAVISRSQSSSSAVVPAPPTSSMSLTSSSSSMAPSSTTSHGQQTQPTHARYRAHARTRKRQRAALGDDERTLMENALRAGCRQRLEKDVSKGIALLYKATKDPADRKEISGTELKQSLINVPETPRYVLSNAETKYRGTKTEPVLRSSVRVRQDIARVASPSVIEVWRATVREDFDSVWRTSIQEHEERDIARRKNKGKQVPNGKVNTENCDDESNETKDWRTCTVSVKQILRQEFDEDDYQRILELLDDGQVYSTDLEDAMYNMVHKQTLMVAGGVLYESGTQQLSLTDLLPPGYPIEEGSATINVAPLPNGLQKAIEEKSQDVHKDIISLFDQNHLDKMVTHFSKVEVASSEEQDHVARPRISAKDKEDHPLWSALSEGMARDSRCPPIADRDGHSDLSRAHLRQCATAVENLWSGKVYTKSLEYLLRYLLVEWLAPERAAANKERARKYAEKKAARVAARSAARSSHLARSHWRHAMRQLLDKLACCIQSGQQAGVDKDLILVNDGDDEWGQEDLNKDMDGVMEQIAQIDEDAQEHSSGSRAPASNDKSSSNSNSRSRAINKGKGRATPIISKLGESSGEKTKEPNRQTLRRLQALIKVLLESPSSKDSYDLDHVKKSVFKDCKFSEKELQVALQITNFLRPFVPRRWQSEDEVRQHTPHVALRAPLALIANAVLRLLGYSDYTRKIAPHVSAGDLHGLLLGAPQLFNVLCKADPGHYDVAGQYGDIASAEDIASTPANKGLVFAGFFDTTLIDKICRDHGFSFGHRMIYVDKYTLHLSGPQIKEGGDRHPVRSTFEARKKAGGNGEIGKWRREFRKSGLSKEQVEAKVDEASAVADTKKEEREGPRKAVTDLRRQCTMFNHQIKHCTPDNKPDLMSQLKEKQYTLRLAELQLQKLDKAWDAAKKARNFWSRMLTGAKTAGKDKTGSTGHESERPITMTKPTWDLPCAEDTPQHLDLQELLDSHRTKTVTNRTRIVVPWAEDPGVKTLSENAFLTVEGITESINRYHLLHDLEKEPVLNKPRELTPEQRQAARQQAQNMKLPRAHRITARQVDEVSFGRHQRRARERLLGKDTHRDAKEALERISDPRTSLTTATTMEQVDAAVKARTPVTGVLRRFNRDPALVRLRRTGRHRQKRAWSRLASHLRSSAADHTVQRLTPEEQGIGCVDPATGFCSRCRKYEIGKKGPAKSYHHPTHCIHTTPIVRPIALTGAAGSGVGSRLQGNFRLGGGKIREQHRQYGVVVVTDEHMTSQTCSICYMKTRPARSRRMVDGKQKVVSLGGAKECTNPLCPAFKVGYTTRPRDTQACVCIGTSGFSALTLRGGQVAEPAHGVGASKAEPNHGVGAFKVEPAHGVGASKAEPNHGVGAFKVEPDHGVGSSKAEPNHGVGAINAEPDHGVGASKAEPDYGVGPGHAVPSHGVGTLREPISPFRSFLRPNEHQLTIAGGNTRHQLPGGSMVTPERDIA
ncbi:hypothetical protein EC968_007570 [Mortierella alpina]|nr:hypothetical protein EC968_007570 [Mortierella alpina]